MEIRKLETEEHVRTRELWEAVFSEDTDRFLDYYYEYMTSHNDIYVVEKDSEIVSMLHMNPYQMMIKGTVFSSHYIVAVATKECERKQGLMGKLLRRALHDSYHSENPFVYLMPAAEEIYKPYDFVTVCEQKHYQYLGPMEGANFVSHNPSISFEYAKAEHCEKLAEFVNEHIGASYQIFTYRDESYYRQLLKEQACQKGGIIIVRKAGKMVGCFLTANEGYQQVRELIFLKGMLEELDLLLEVKEAPKIMARATHVEKLLLRMYLSKGGKNIYHIKDNIIENNTGVYRMSPSYGGMRCRKISNEINESEAMSVSEITKLVFENSSVLLNEIV